MASGANGRKTFRLILIKPSHYDDDGYVIQWLRSPIPANSLACLYGLALDAQARDVLGPTTRSTSRRSTRPTRGCARTVSRSGSPRPAGGMVMLVGVQSNQFPRALDIARPLREARRHRRHRRLPRLRHARHAAVDRPRRAGGARHRLLHVCRRGRGRPARPMLKDAVNGRLAPIYNFMKELPGIEHVPIAAPAGLGDQAHLRRERQLRRRARLSVPVLVLHHHQRAGAQVAPPLAGRRRAHRARQRRAGHLPLLHHRRQLRPQQGLGADLRPPDPPARGREDQDRLIIQVDTLCHRLPNFIEKAARAGVKRVFIGLENINPDNLVAAKKKQNKITEYRKMLLAWKNVGVITYAGYILGFPNDTPERSAATSR